MVRRCQTTRQFTDLSLAGLPAFLAQAADKFFILSTGHSTTGLDAIGEVTGNTVRLTHSPTDLVFDENSPGRSHPAALGHRRHTPAPLPAAVECVMCNGSSDAQCAAVGGAAAGSVGWVRRATRSATTVLATASRQERQSIPQIPRHPHHPRAVLGRYVKPDPKVSVFRSR